MVTLNKIYTRTGDGGQTRLASGAPVLPPLLQRHAAQDIYTAAAKQQNGEYFPMWSGQSVGLIRDLPGAGEVVETIVREARAVLATLATSGIKNAAGRRTP